MAINAISAYSASGLSNYYNYQSAISQSKLINSLKNINKTDKTALSYTSSVAKNDSTDFLKTYSSSMAGLKTAANALKPSNSAGALNQLGAKSSDVAVATATTKFKPTEAVNYEVTVSKVAKAQKNQTQAVDSKALANAGVGLNIISKSGTTNINVSATDEKGNQKSNGQMLNEIASKINSASSDVKASVIEKDGKSTLEIRANNTGESGSFVVEGDYAESTGLATATTEAQNAEYTVKADGGTAKSYTSESNDVEIDYGKIGLSLKDTGTTNVSIGPDEDKIVDAMKNLVKAYNTAVSDLSDNVGRGSGVSSQLASMQRGPEGEKSLALVGLSKNKDGTLALDEAALRKNLKEDPSLVKNVLGNVADSVDRTATSGMSRSSGSLINNDLKQLQLTQMNDNYNFLNIFSRSGANNINNYYAVGMMMNLLV